MAVFLTEGNIFWKTSQDFEVFVKNFSLSWLPSKEGSCLADAGQGISPCRQWNRQQQEQKQFLHYLSILFKRILNRFDKVGNIPFESSRPTNHQRGILHTKAYTSKRIICFLLFGYKSSKCWRNGQTFPLLIHVYPGCSSPRTYRRQTASHFYQSC